MSPKKRDARPPNKFGGSKCASCGKPAAADYAPFCSKRCADVDLHRWLTESYAVPDAEGQKETADGSPSSDSPSDSGGD